mmetsp:Transcript_2908/g.4028  ORF Transcript_2908/g.4028 Transcript_2908/m.4028 type:complete len:139 (-) Transcript_2908:281-697(-)
MAETADPRLPSSNYHRYSADANQLSTNDAQSNQNEAIDLESVVWTRPDSSYGAACPICGFLPKRIRKKMEYIILLSLATLFVGFVITASIRLSNDKSKGDGDKSSYSVPKKWDYDDDYYFDEYNMTNSTDDFYDDVYE